MMFQSIRPIAGLLALVVLANSCAVSREIHRITEPESSCEVAAADAIEKKIAIQPKDGKVIRGRLIRIEGCTLCLSQGESDTLVVELQEGDRLYIDEFNVKIPGIVKFVGVAVVASLVTFLIIISSGFEGPFT